MLNASKIKDSKFRWPTMKRMAIEDNEEQQCFDVYSQ
jgi:hypothetical protein